jgi:hypothetical protein
VELKNLYLDPTNKTPEIDLNQFTGELILAGRSIPENAAKLYENLLMWVTQYSLNPRQTTNLRLNLEYFNTASTIWIAKMIKALCGIKKPEATLMIHLYFEIEEFENMEEDDLRDTLSPIIDMIGATTVNLGIKIYGTDEKGEILRESMVLL